MNLRFSILLFILVCTISLSAQVEPVKIEGEAQGSTYHITYYDIKNRDFKLEIEKILRDFDLSVSTYIPNSVISLINSNEKNVKVDKYFEVCFKKAREVWDHTEGAFDPTVYPLVNAWGFGPGKKIKIEKIKLDSILNFVGFEKIELGKKGIVKKDPRVSLDFNAFAQGYSVDVVSDFLNLQGISSYLVEIGGEVYAKGKKQNGDKWKIGIEKPIDNPDSENSLKAIVNLENLAVATSGNYRKFFIEDGVKYSHTIDPKTGFPASNNLLSVSVFASDCISADAYATGLLVMGLERAIKFLENHKEIMAYLIYFDDKGNYQIFESTELKSIISDAQ